MSTMMTRMTIASPATIESTGAAVLVPHLAPRGFDVVVFTKRPAPSANTLMHAPSNATNALMMYVPSSSVKDGGTTAPTASSLATVVATSTAAAAAPTTATAMATATATVTTSFLNYKIITLSNINL